jgi:hypothetical protein
VHESTGIGVRLGDTGSSFLVHFTGSFVFELLTLGLGKERLKGE